MYIYIITQSVFTVSHLAIAKWGSNRKLAADLDLRKLLHDQSPEGWAA